MSTGHSRLIELILKCNHCLFPDRRGFAHVECFSVEDASALIEAHEAWPLRDSMGRLLRMNYDLQKEPWNVLCVSSFTGSSEKLGEVFANYGCAEGVEKVTACELYL